MGREEESQDVRSDFIKCRTAEPAPYVSVLLQCIVLTEINISVFTYSYEKSNQTNSLERPSSGSLYKIMFTELANSITALDVLFRANSLVQERLET